MFKEYRFNFKDVCPDDKTLAAVLQITDECAYRDMSPVISNVLDRLYNYTDIIGGYTIRRCDSTDADNGIVFCEGTELKTGKRIASYMEEATRLALFVCTAGPLFTDLSNEYLTQGDLPEAFITDAVGSVTVENAMSKIRQSLEEDMKLLGLNTGNCYSPGYCEWNIKGQQTLFSLIDSNPTGVTLTESCLMQPIKSVSGIIGIGKNLQKRPSGCSICHNTTCVYRRIKRN